MTPLHEVKQLSDAELLSKLEALVRSSNRTTADLILHLAEVESRRLHYRAACSSLFTYCTQRLGLSEQAAYKRITAARVARKYPVVFELVEEGLLHLSGLCSLAPHLRPANHRELLLAATGKTRRQIEELVAVRFPRPDAPQRIRKVPERRGGPQPERQPNTWAVVPKGADSQASAVRAQVGAAPGKGSPAEIQPPARAGKDGAGAPPCPAPGVSHQQERPAQQVKPMSEAHYRVQFTASAELRDKIERAQELLSHAIPSGDLAAVFDRALELLIQQQLKERFAVGNKPAGGGRSAGSPEQVKSSGETRSRYIPAAVRREVWERDGGQCTYVDAQGRRCSERRFLELHHRRPFARGGTPTADNLRLLCGSHNRVSAERAYGKDRMARVVAASQQRRATTRSGTRPREPTPEAASVRTGEHST